MTQQAKRNPIVNSTPTVVVLHNGFCSPQRDQLVNELITLRQPVFHTGEMLRSQNEAAPENPIFHPVRHNRPVDDRTVLGMARTWHIAKTTPGRSSAMLHYDNVPMSKNQTGFVKHLQDRGCLLKFVWYAPPDDLTSLPGAARKDSVYTKESLPLLDFYKRWARGNLLEVDPNLDLEETIRSVFGFIGLPVYEKIPDGVKVVHFSPAGKSAESLTGARFGDQLATAIPVY